MSVFKGEKLNIEIYGTSHAEKIGAKVSGFPKIKIDEENLNSVLKRRRTKNAVFSTKRNEPDEPIFEKGVLEYDAKNMRFLNNASANKHLYSLYDYNKSFIA